jgi:hypothetical protein
LLNIDQFKLVSNFSRHGSEHGGSCIFVKKYIHTEEVIYFKGINKEKDFEMSVVELLDYKIILVCVYRSPDSDFYIFLSKLEFVIQEVQSKRKKLILSWDWNINFMQESEKLSNLKNLLLMYNLYNIVMVPTRITEY